MIGEHRRRQSRRIQRSTRGAQEKPQMALSDSVSINHDNIELVILPGARIGTVVPRLETALISTYLIRSE